MAGKKYLTEDKLVNILQKNDSGDELIPELEDSSECEDKIPLVETDVTIQQSEVRDTHHPSYCPPLPLFTANTGVKFQVHNEAQIMSYVNLFFNDDFYFRATLGVKEVLQSSKNSTSIFL